MQNVETATLSSAWRQCWGTLGNDAEGTDLYQRLLSAYTEPHRHYHTLQHLSECLALFERYRDLAQAPTEVEIALWFHDAVYDVRASDNEARSAAWAVQELGRLNVPADRIERIESHILATCHTALPQGQDQVLLVDIDLAILGAPAERFDEYEAQVRQEYGWVPGFIFRRKRREILAGLLARPCIYGTPALHQEREERARANLARSLQQL
ncbi:MAG: N-methyl-D-aspartate receptor NMDAR2C subunit [Gammaproteobacteria bacterium]|nr:N-methyl-D-aspartate receptor NMDAR2C subunit [Gammaproteobacteria bacterium]MDH5653465.1 N-methyl-D-aspartate receptor NMDAR2C subunit [Gammaproteobacteria bacterium]